MIKDTRKKVFLEAVAALPLTSKVKPSLVTCFLLLVTAIKSRFLHSSVHFFMKFINGNILAVMFRIKIVHGINNACHYMCFF